MLNKAALKISLILLVLTIAAFVTQKTLPQEFPGNYPRFAPPVEAVFDFTDQRIRISVPEELNGFRVFVFAYDPQGHMQAIIKPVEDGIIEVDKGDCSDIEVRFDQGNQVADFEILKRMDGYTRGIDMCAALREAKEKGRQSGIQRCLYPVNVITQSGSLVGK